MTAQTEGKKTWIVRIGEACVLALAVAAFTAIPTALRTASAGAPFASGALAGAAVLLPPVALTLLLARAAGRGFRAIAGPTPRRVIAFGMALWVGMSVPALTLLARLLKSHTHHRGLGGATFALVGAFVVLMAVAAAHRLVVVGKTLVARGARPWILAALGSAICVIPLLVAAAPLAAHGGGEGAPEVRAAVVDGAVAIAAIALVASLELGDRFARMSATWGVPLAAVVVIGGVANLEASPDLARAVRAGGGLPATLLGVVQTRSDGPARDAGARVDLRTFEDELYAGSL